VVAADPAANPPEVIQAVAVRRYGRWVTAVVILLVIAWLVRTFGGVVDDSYITKYLFHPLIIGGARNTIILAVLAQGIGIALGVVLAVMRLSRNPVASASSWLYIWFFRGTPVLVQLFFWFTAVPLAFHEIGVGLPFTHLVLWHTQTVDFITSFTAALIGLSLNEGAYMAEIVRAGILAVDEGQHEAAQALGMTSGLTMRRIVLPQAMRVIVPPTGNEFISMLKTTSLASAIVYEELLRRASNIYSTNLHPIELLVVASVWYLAMTTVASIGQYYVERRLARGRVRELPPTPLQRLRGAFR
jgi:polar amino acid transport system permease protein